MQEAKITLALPEALRLALEKRPAEQDLPTVRSPRGGDNENHGGAVSEAARRRTFALSA